jgi:hypothetical protein
MSVVDAKENRPLGKRQYGEYRETLASVPQGNSQRAWVSYNSETRSLNCGLTRGRRIDGSTFESLFNVV